MGEARSAIDQRFQITLRASDGEVLEQITAGIHDGDNHARQAFSKRRAAAIEINATASTPIRLESKSRIMELARLRTTGRVPAAKAQCAKSARWLHIAASPTASPASGTAKSMRLMIRSLIHIVLLAQLVESLIERSLEVNDVLGPN
jgi:hypothetical protein